MRTGCLTGIVDNDILGPDEPEGEGTRSVMAVPGVRRELKLVPEDVEHAPELVGAVNSMGRAPELGGVGSSGTV